MESLFNVGDFDTSNCVLCCKNTDEVLMKVTDKGLGTLIDCSKKRGAVKLSQYLLSSPVCVHVHNSCRKRFTDSRTIGKPFMDDDDAPSTKRLRSTGESFQWKEMCCLCCELVGDYSSESGVRRASTLQLHETILKRCTERLAARENDKWAFEVQGRMQSCIDLIAAEAVYHVYCFMRFTSNRDLEIGRVAVGRPENAIMSQTFSQLCDWLEGSAEGLYTVEELQLRMNASILTEEACHSSDEGASTNIISRQHLKRKLIDRYGDHIFFAEVSGRKNVVCFKDICSFIVSEKWYADQKETVADKSERIIRAAAKLLAAQIREMTNNTGCYPTTSDMVNETSPVVPPLLHTFLSGIIPSKLKQRSIGEAIVQAARPRSTLAPLLLGLSLDIDSQHGSESLIVQLSRLGFCLSYDETVRYKQSVMMVQNPEKPQQDAFPSAFTQWVGDNVDHNIRTLDGLGTFHGMGVIAVSTAATRPSAVRDVPVVIPRLKHRLPASALNVNRGIPIKLYTGDSKVGLHVTMKPVCQLQQPIVLPPLLTVGLVWHMSAFVEKLGNTRPNWSGYMQTVCEGDHSPPADIEMLQLIDMHPTDKSCIFSTLMHVCEQGRKLNVTPSITFDQPLWLKACAISRAVNADVVCRLGGFHTVMNFLGSIGSVMAGSGLEELFGLIYGQDTVTHMLSGKAYARAMRAHYLVESALTIKLLRFILPVADKCSHRCIEGITTEEMLELQTTVLETWSKKIAVDDSSILDSRILRKVNEQLSNLKTELSSESRTARLWMQYIHYIDIVKQFIMAERTSNWHLHLKSVADMLNLFAATGHNNYAKSARLYLQLMVELPSTHPWLYEMYSKHGLHSARRSDRFWAGLSTDLLIEQTMMKAVKGRGGLTRGRGFNDSVRTMWISTAHHLGNVHLAMSSVVGMTDGTDEHMDVGMSRVSRDSSDLQKIIEWLDCNDPFVLKDGKLRSIATGLTAGDDVNITCDMAEDVGAAIHKEIDGQLFVDIKLKKSDRVRSLAVLHKAGHAVKKDVIADACALFGRLIILAERSVDIPTYFDYELTPVPSSLFHNDYMRKPDKPALAKCLIGDLFSAIPAVVCYIVDGGAMLHRVRWLKKANCSDVLQQYVTYVSTHYGPGTIVVFDGYMAHPSTKDHEHRRRTSKVAAVSADVALEERKAIIFEQQAFFANDRNKDQFIKLLMVRLEYAGFQTVQSSADADVDIALTAVNLASSQQHAVAVVADDTDVLVLLVHHFIETMADVYIVRHGGKADSLRKQFSIRDIRQQLGSEKCQQLLVTHAIGGCDTTSALYGIGKAKVFKKITARRVNKSLVNILQNSGATYSDVITAGLQIMVNIYGGKPGDKLSKMRHEVYCKLAATSTVRPLPQKLPPTERAAVFHVLRVHLQAVTWRLLSNDVGLDPLLWGWQLVDNRYEPVTSDQLPAPDDLLNIVRCKCKSDCRSALCSCRKNGLNCVTACTGCHGQCTNKNSPESISDGHIDVIRTHDDCDDDDDIHVEVFADEDYDWQYEETVEATLSLGEQVYMVVKAKMNLKLAFHI
jgi:hypothetical protein